MVFTSFNFHVEITLPGASGFVCQAAFSECDGLEASMEPKTFKEGGNNTQQIHLAGPITYSELTLKRGMTSDFGLWQWFNEVIQTQKRGQRAQISIAVLAADHQTLQVTFKLRDCLPVKLKAPTLNAREGGLAVEELTVVYAAFDVEYPS
jgi:phage tail-like protein